MTEPSLSDSRLVCLKDGGPVEPGRLPFNTYAIFDRFGDIAADTNVAGVYIDDMRYVSQFLFRLGGERLYALQSNVSEDNSEQVVRLVNPVLTDSKGKTVPEKAIQITRRTVVCDGLVHQAIEYTNRGTEAYEIPVTFDFGSDFKDMFDVRSRNATPVKGKIHSVPIEGNNHWIVTEYTGRDKRAHRAGVMFGTDAPLTLDANQKAAMTLRLAPGETQTHYIEYGRQKPDAIGPSQKSYSDAVRSVRSRRQEFIANGVELNFSNVRLQRWFSRSTQDIALLMNKYETGSYICAGLPWFAVPFGRDGIITAMEMLWANPDIAKGTLAFLAARQADKVDAFSDSEPGKIMHETRNNERSMLGLDPFRLYYGGVDTTMLFVVLADLYYARTGDAEFVKEIAHNLDAALQWMETYGENEDGFLTYSPKAETGLANQMWKDSSNSIMYEDGNINVKYPRAVCEVQGYAYAAWEAGARFAGLTGDAEKVAFYKNKAERLQRSFNEKFWDQEKGYYYLALDGDGVPCKVKASNMGQLLFTGIVPEERVDSIAKWMANDVFFTGFAVRTLASDEQLYNELEYHNGPPWPHDNALIARGLGQSGYGNIAAKIFNGLLDAADYFEWRLPELFAGFAREEGLGPASYPSSCTPQAWAAAVPFQILQAVTGMKFDLERKTVRLNLDHWQEDWGNVAVKNLNVGGEHFSFEISAKPGGGAMLKPGRGNVQLEGNSVPVAIPAAVYEP